MRKPISILMFLTLALAALLFFITGDPASAPGPGESVTLPAVGQSVDADAGAPQADAAGPAEPRAEEAAVGPEAAEKPAEQSARRAEDLMPGYIQAVGRRRAELPLVTHRHADADRPLPAHAKWPTGATRSVSWSEPGPDGEMRRVTVVQPSDLPYPVRVEEMLHHDPRNLERLREMPDAVEPRHVELLAEEIADAVMVRLGEGKTEADLRAAAARIGAEPARVLSHRLSAYRIQLPEITPDGAPEAVLALADIGVETGSLRTVETDSIVRKMDLVPNDPQFQDGTLWGMNNIKGPGGWAIQNTAEDVIIGVIDTGVNYNHPDLGDNMWINPSPGSYPGISGDIHGINAITMSGDPMDDQGHGTHVAGTVAAVGNNGVGVVGVAWEAQIMGLKFLSAQGGGAIGDAITCLDYAIEMGAHLTNNSWGGGPPNQTLFELIQDARDADQLFIAAAGNSANNNDISPIYPATYPVDNVIAVSAINTVENLASFSTFGPSTVLLGAPGTQVHSTYHESPWYQSFNGTSMAAPHVAGAAALILQHHNFETYDVVKARLTESARQIPGLQGRVITEGTLDLPAALSVEEDGNMAVRLTVRGQQSSSFVFAGEDAVLSLSLTDLLPVSDATITASADPAGPQGASITFAADPAAPGVYTADYTLPTFAGGEETEMVVSLNISAPGKNTYTDNVVVDIQTRPENRFLASALELDAANPGSVTINNTFAEKEPGERERINFLRFRRSLWYTWTPESVASVEINTLGSLTNAGSDMDTVLAVYTSPVSDPGMGDLVEVVTNADISGENRLSRVTFDVLEPGTTYWIQTGDAYRAGDLQLNVIPVFEAPIVTQEPPASVTVFEGLPLRLNAFLAGADSFQWLKDGQPLSEGGRFSGTQTPNLVVDPAIASDAGSYQLRATNQNGSQTTPAAVVTVQTPTGLSSWTRQDPQPTGNDLGGIAHGAGRKVTVGSQGTLLVRSDGAAEWERVSTGTDARLNDVLFHAGQGFIAVGDGGTILVSSDGGSWTTAASGTGQALRAVATNGSKYVAVGGDYLEGIVLESADGQTWTDRTPAGLESVLYSVVWAGTRFVAVGGHWRTDTGIVMDSGDGISWTEHSLNDVPTLHGVSHDGGTLVAVGGDWLEPVILLNTGATSWDEAMVPSEETLYGVGQAGTLWLAFGERGTLLSSADGLNWTSLDSGTDFALRGAVWDGTDFTLVGDGGVILESGDGAVWTLQNPGTRVSLEDIDGGGLGLMTVGEKGAARFSADGLNWQDASFTPGQRFLGVATNGSVFVKVGQGGDILSSSNNGDSWTSRFSKENRALEAVTRGNVFVAVGSGGTIVSSSNGTSWTERTSPTSLRLRAVAYNGSEWRAVGQDGVILGSGNGSSWQMVHSGLGTTLRGITHNGDDWIAVGDGGAIWLSVDGNDWNQISPPANRTLHAVTSGGGTTFAVGSGGTLLTSADGLVWEKRNTRVSANLLGAAYNDGLLVAVGGMGTVLTSVALDTVATPEISPDSVGNEASVVVTLTTATEGADIFYTLDGSEPTPSSTPYINPFTLTNPTPVKARAFKEGMEASGLAERTYFLQGAPFILEPAKDLALAVGGSGNLMPVISGDEPMTFRWETSADPAGPWTAVPGGDSGILSFTNAQSGDAGHYRLLVENAVDELVSDPVRVWVWEVPAITTQPQDVTVGSGSPVTLTVEASGGGPLSYQWRKDGEPISGATGASYTLSSASLTASGVYSVEVSSPVGSVVSDNATLTVGIPPRFLTQPQPLTRAAGDSAALSVSLSGSEPMTVEWQFQAGGSGDFISLGVTTPTLTLNDASGADSGNYRVVASNAYGSRTSEEAVLTVLEVPTITAQPSDTSIILSQSGGFSVGVSGAEPFSYQWLKNGNVVPGGTGSTLAFASVQAEDGAGYSVLVSNEVGAVQSASATLTVLFPAVITGQPTEQDVEIGQNGTFTVTAAGTDLTYQWQENLEGSWTDLTGEESPQLVLSAVTKEDDDGRQFRVIVDNAYGDPAISSVAALNVLEAPSIVADPQSQSIVLGQSVTFEVEVDGDEPLSYRWRRNGSNISGATSSTYTINSVTANRDGDVYTVRVTNPVGEVISAGAALTILYPPTILNQPNSQVAAVGDTVTFSVLADGDPTLLYQWRKDGADIDGANGASLTLEDVDTGDAADYSVEVTNDYGNATSSNATLTVRESLDFVHAVRITFDGYTDSEVLTNFPVPVKLNNGILGFDYDGFVSEEGGDLRFWTSDLQPLVYEIEQWDTDGDSYVWVRLPELAQGTFIYASWGDAEANPVPNSPEYTWTGDFLAAWHLHTDPENTPDSANLVSDNSGSLDTTQTSVNPALVPGVIGPGFEIRNNSTHRVLISNDSHLAERDQATFSFWYRRDITGGPNGEIFAHARSGINRRIGYYWGGSDYDDGIAFYPRVASGTVNSPDLYSGTLSVGQWYHVAVTQDRSGNNADFRLYIDGVEVDTALNRSLNSSDRWILEPNRLIGGSFPDSTPNATLDEMRMASTVRSPAWIRAEYLSMNDPHSFGTYEPATVIPNTPIITMVTPAADTVRIPGDVGMLLEAEVTEPVEESGALAYTWTALTGPGPVAFSDPNGLSTAAAFSGLGEYILRLDVTNTEDSSLNAEKLLTVIVTDEEFSGGGGSSEWSGAALGLEGGGFSFEGGEMVLEAQNENGSLGSDGINGDLDIAYFVSVPVTGDGVLTARLTQNGATSGISNIWSSMVGLMILDDPEETNTAKFASTLAQQRSTGINDFQTFTRSSPSQSGGLRQLRTYETGTGPVRLRIQRTGNTIQSFVENTGGTWQELYTATMTGLSEEVHVGFYLTSWAQDHTATFDQIELDFAGEAADNIGPWVFAGADAFGVRDEAITLYGEMEDDGLPDPPGEVTLAWAQLSGPETVSLSDPSALQPAFTASVNGEYRFRLAANDGEVTTFADVTIDVQGSNPVAFTSEPVVNAVVGEAYSYTATFTGGDEATLNFNAPGLPDWLVLSQGSDGREWILSGTPGVNDQGGHSVQLVASDGDSEATQDFGITVWPEGTVPGMPEIVLLPQGDIEPTTADLNADLLKGEEPVTVKVWYGPSDGGSDAGAWAEELDLGDQSVGEIAATLTGLTEESTYYYRFVATNNVGEAQTATDSFTTPIDLSGIEPQITLIRPTVECVRIPEGVGLVLETEVTETGGESGQLTLLWEHTAGAGNVSWETTDTPETVAWFSAQGEYTLRLTADNGVNSEVLEISVEVVDPALVSSGDAGTPTEELLLLVDFNHQTSIGGYSPPSSGAAPRNPNPDGNGHYWNTIHRNVIGNNSTSENLQTSDGGGSSISLFMSSGIGNPTTDGQWTGADPARPVLPAWVPSDVPNSQNPLDDRANISNSNGIFRLSGLPELAPGETFRLELVSATTFTGAGANDPGLFNLEAANSTGGNRAGNDVDSIVPRNGLDGVPLVWHENSGSNPDRFGFAFNSRTDADMGGNIPNQGWIVWDHVLADSGEISIHASAQGGDARAPVNALAVYIVSEDHQNIGPLVNAGEAQTVNAGEEVTLNGTVQDDGLPEDPGTVTTEWIQLSGPETVTLSGPSGLSPNFTPTGAGEYSFRLIAFDGEVATADEVTVTVEDEPLTPFEEWLAENELDHLDPDAATVIKGGREVSLREAYLLGDDPGDPDDVLHISEMTPQPDGETLRLYFPGLANRVYRVEYTHDLSAGTWTLEPAVFEGGGETLSLDVPLPSGDDAPQRFYRIRVGFPE
ncbi:MAG: immunoglobulin domain-containing protein [Verrucomicrobia bacterium]|nr:immunoglobulin domain-containing protein [Verrucomicrobiota bacterium]MCH8527047.1 immunoglobulin domain-containing protein [Kiritimatiellia bacterium]